MRTLHNYVEWIAQSVGIKLNDEKLNRITQRLAMDEEYKDLLNKLEKMIREENKIKWKKM